VPRRIVREQSLLASVTRSIGADLPRFVHEQSCLRAETSTLRGKATSVEVVTASVDVIVESNEKEKA
jgi:hypothetical protein